MSLCLEGSIFVQIGATRDGLDPYLKCAKKRGMQTFLVESPAYLAFRKDLSRKVFDHEIAVDDPADPVKVTDSLEKYKERISLILAGFECYSPAAYDVANRLKILPWRNNLVDFRPLNKDEQRVTLRNKAPEIFQPNFLCFSDSFIDQTKINLRYPLMIKPTNGGGGLGVYLVFDDKTLSTVVENIKLLTNYNGASFDGLIIEEYISGKELSLQGYCQNNTVTILSCCEKIIELQLANSLNAKSFYEAGHIAISGDKILEEIRIFAEQCVAAFNYNAGPFHIDLIVNDKGIYFIEMGYRLSGGAIVELVEKATGINWAEKAFTLFLEEEEYGISEVETYNRPLQCIGLATIRNNCLLQKAELLRKQGKPIDVVPFLTNGKTIAAKKELSTSLRSDVTRHGSGVARIWINESSIDRAREIMLQCLHSDESNGELICVA